MNKELIKEIEKIANNHNITITKNSNGEFTKEFIEEFQNKVNWYYISCYQQLSEKFIEEFQNKIFWFNICYNRILSEKFIEKFQDKINLNLGNWCYISCYQKLSEKFIRKHLDKLNIKDILKYQSLNNNFKNFLKTYE
jgi:hypothetical protein